MSVPTGEQREEKAGGSSSTGGRGRGRDFLGMPAQVRNAQSVRKLGGRERGEEGRGRRGTESLPRWEGREGRWRVKGHSMQADKMEAWGGKRRISRIESIFLFLCHIPTKKTPKLLGRGFAAHQSVVFLRSAEKNFIRRLETQRQIFEQKHAIFSAA